MSTPPLAYPMSTDERAALSISATGLSVTDVAGALAVSPDLVRTWLASAVEKLRARSKLEAVLIADRLGELDRI